MTRAVCTVESRELLEYWLGELDATAGERLEEHLFACPSCTERLQAIVDLGRAVRGEFLRGALNIVLPEPFLRRAAQAGLRLREYTLEPGGSVNCTITPEDDLVVSHLRAPLDGVRRLDVLVENTVSGKFRVNDVPFDPESGGLLAVTSSVYLRTWRSETQQVRLVAVEGTEERVIGDYRFNHFPSS